MPEPFSKAITITPTGEGTFQGAITPDWSQGRAAFGGLLSGQMLRAAQTLLPPLPLRTVVIDFLAPASPGTVRLVASVLRTGRSMSRVEVQLLQGETRCATMLAAFGPHRKTAITHLPPAVPPTPPLENLTPLPWVEDVIPRFTRQFEYRFIGARFPFSAQAEPGIGGLVRLKDTEPVDVAGVLALIDAWPSPALPMLSRPAAASTVTWMVNIVDGLVATPPMQWWRFEASLVSSTGGFSDTEGRLWSPDGRLVATSRQLVAEFSRG